MLVLECGFEFVDLEFGNCGIIVDNGDVMEIGYGVVVIVVIISCMNMSNFFVMLVVGLFVKKVVEKGLVV